MIWSSMYVVDVACIVGGQGGIFYLVYRIGEDNTGGCW